MQTINAGDKKGIQEAIRHCDRTTSIPSEQLHERHSPAYGHKQRVPHGGCKEVSHKQRMQTKTERETNGRDSDKANM
jgi:hypothetical protein